jgi:hypothetical protein
VVLWALSYYVGHVWKDTHCLPRPPAYRAGTATKPPFGVVRLEHHYEHEYGMPSTHAMNAVTMPWYTLILSLHRFTGPPIIPVAFACFWTISCVFSRVYMGVHSPADIFMGILLGLGLLGFGCVFGDTVDGWIISSPNTMVVAIVIAIVLVATYPRPAKPMWLSSPGDSTLIIASAVGVVIGVNALPQLHAKTPEPFGFEFTPRSIMVGVASLLIGYTVAFLTRLVVKAVAVKALVFLLGPRFGPADDMSIQPHLNKLRRAQLLQAEANAEAKAKEAGTEGENGDVEPVSSNGLRQRKTGNNDIFEGPLPSPSPTASDKENFRTNTYEAPPGMVWIPPSRRYDIELPVKLLTYAAVGINTTITVPLLLQALGLWQYGI